MELAHGPPSLKTLVRENAYWRDRRVLINLVLFCLAGNASVSKVFLFLRLLTSH